ncbi:mRNA splicing protein [Starmerella bacillaris]|uniref:Sm protein F n=1 Tax=Starmerella bacillaris TaxID=1247836 RepID=A0AAV5RGP6_STABA|nr:mRNA splicing protein [Starmerella bacillaris]
MDIVNPRPFLKSLAGKKVVVKLKWGNTEYRGNLVSTDSYMNVQLQNAEEVIDGKVKGTIDEVFIRCNNVMWINTL